jgi:hypothetical protein
MKKILLATTIVILLVTMLSFVFVIPKNTDAVMRKPINKTIINKKTCSCSTPTNIVATRSGGVVTVTWNAVPGAMSYTVGGYLSCDGHFDNLCTTTNSIMFSASCFVTLRVTSYCDVTNCMKFAVL